ncbi:hypothetical protein Cch01nite_43020 [Cellulomonas chitinilytica]|uniref:PASTA domain-containing protein n=1 Tax=Cellulomonas chitinilytica TaxID=398759 RepID=A0A919P7S4_9CELL|nr:hypothetical protein [Cellulomonas chitinilytica]GIG23578.1 hypothetical protein Cch01nite_43020 [Cellulomonas chitinilytica]
MSELHATAAGRRAVALLSSPRRKTAVAVVILAVVLVLMQQSLKAVDDSGIVDRDFEQLRIAVALLGGLAVAVTTHKLLGWNALSAAWQNLIAVVVGVAVVAVTVLVGRGGDQEFVLGRLDGQHPFAQRTLLSGGSGYRYYITLEGYPKEMSARLQLRGSGTPIEGEKQNDGTVVAEGVLTGDATWTALVTLLTGEGPYRLYVDSAPPMRLDGPSDSRAASFDAGRTRAGFVFESDGRWSTAHIHVRSAGGAAVQDTPGLALKDDRGRLWATAPLRGTGSVDTTIPRGSYVVEVQGAVAGQGFTLSLDLEPAASGASPDPSEPAGPTGPSTPAPTATSTPVPTVPSTPVPTVPSTPAPTEPSTPVTADDVAVPDVAGQPATDAAHALTDAGFVAEVVTVCSTSLHTEGAPVGTTRQVVLAGATSTSEEVEVVAKDHVVIPVLPRGTVLTVKSYSGLPCR